MAIDKCNNPRCSICGGPDKRKSQMAQEQLRGMRADMIIFDDVIKSPHERRIPTEVKKFVANMHQQTLLKEIFNRAESSPNMPQTTSTAEVKKPLLSPDFEVDWDEVKLRTLERNIKDTWESQYQNNPNPIPKYFDSLIPPEFKHHNGTWKQNKTWRDRIAEKIGDENVEMVVRDGIVRVDYPEPEPKPKPDYGNLNQTEKERCERIWQAIHGRRF